MYPLAVLTGDHINKGFFLPENVCLFCQAKKTGRSNEVQTVLPRWP